MSSYYEKFLATGEVKCIDEEIPFEIPATWEWCRLGDVIQLLSGRDLEPYHYNSDGIGIPYMTGASNFCHEELIVNRWTEDPVTVSHIGDLLITCKGTIGTMAFNNIGDVHIARQIMCISSSYVSLKYIKLCLEIHVAKLQKAARSIIPGISRDDMLYAIIPLPPIEEQNRIVSKIREVLTYVERYTHSQTALHLLNESIKPLLRKSILQEAIQGKLVPQIESEGTANELLEQIQAEKQKLVKEGKLKKSALTDSVIYKGDDNKYYEQTGSEIACIDDIIPFDLPTSWCWVRHNQLFEVSGGSQPPKSHFIDHYREGYIRLYQIRDYGTNPVPVYVPINEISKITRKGDILLARYGGSLGKVFWAEEGAYNVAMAKVIPLYKSELIHKEYIFLYYCSNIYQSTILDHSRSAQAGFNKDDLADMLFPLPPYSEQVRIVERYQSIVTSIMRG